MEAAHIEELRLCREGLAVVVVVAENDVIHVHLLRDQQQSSARELRVRRNAYSIKRVQTILAADYVSVFRLHSLAQHFCERLSNPLQSGSFRVVVKGKYQHNLVAWL